MDSRNFKGHTRSSIRGFTLVELLIVMVIAVILTSIAISTYGKYVNKAKVRSAQSGLMALSLSFENQYQRQLAYPNKTFNTTEDLKTDYPLWSSTTPEFNYSAVADGKTYTLKATAKSDTKLVGCVLTLTNNNSRQAVNCMGVTW